MNTAELVRRMSAAGATPEAIAIAMEAIDEAVAGDAERRRRHAERMRTKRARTNAHSNLTVSAQTAARTTPSVNGHAAPSTSSKSVNKFADDQQKLPLTYYPSPLKTLSEVQQRKEEQVEGRKKTRSKKNGMPMPDDFAPSGEHYDCARIDLGRQREFADECCADMRCWAKANSNRSITLKSDWSQALFGWMRKAAKTGPPLRVNGHAPRPGSKDDLRERTANALRALDPFPQADEHRSSADAGSPVIELLPNGGAH